MALQAEVLGLWDPVPALLLGVVHVGRAKVRRGDLDVLRCDGTRFEMHSMSFRCVQIQLKTNRHGTCDCTPALLVSLLKTKSKNMKFSKEKEVKQLVSLGVLQKQQNNKFSLAFPSLATCFPWVQCPGRSLGTPASPGARSPPQPPPRSRSWSRLLDPLQCTKETNRKHSACVHFVLVGDPYFSLIPKSSQIRGRWLVHPNSVLL